MASSLNNQPSLKKEANENGEDRISRLPDSVLVHILSFLPTKYAVRTSILSSRWKHIWASVPILEFNGPILLPSYIPFCKHNDNGSFMNFIDRVLILHDLSSIQRFSLGCNPEIDTSRLNTWIGVAIKRSVHEIDINVCEGLDLKLPRNLFTCNTLVVLKLGSQLHFDVPTSISFPCLRIFHVSLISPSNDLTQKLFSSCPMLEELSIIAVMGPGKTVYNISSSALKTLYLSLCVKEYGDSEVVVIVDAPILDYLCIEDDCFVQYCLNSLSSLVKASVCVDASHPHALGAMPHLNRAFVLLEAISNVKHLHLKSSTMAVLGIANDKSWPVFPNLTHLEFDDVGCKSLPKLLNGVPNLCTMVFTKVPLLDSFEPLEQFYWLEPQGVPSCLRSTLKEIKVSGIDGLQDELNLIKYFLENASVLEKMTIGYGMLSIKEEAEFLRHLVRLPRCSKSCQIELV
ncbi:putative F-box/FBD/LRR-repeat protein [Camellia lanceoleosa]|uniref:F-box/FBD/LRR-repeat protein n=1 Tax=Camellia lanceoleosa TaxID=1840588 RepID=A0ACC0FWR1_9ERIC|nr:putative F-box/FBD/LRR-repeat protein [Camellia lanceoleosa]